MAASRQIEQSKLLVGEGKEEERFFNALIKHLSLTGIQVECYDGKTRLPNYLLGLTGRTGFGMLKSIGVSRDADDNFEAALQSVQGALRNAGFEAPDQCQVRVGDKVQVSVFILPNCKAKGMLESLCLESVSESPGIKCLDEYFECMQNYGRVPDNSDKARVHAWLASEERPDTRLGEAAEMGYWALAHPAFDALKEFLREL